MLWTESKKMFKFLKKTALWIIAVPVLAGMLGSGMNQAVLVANHDRFPVMWSDARCFEHAVKLDKDFMTAMEAGDVDAAMEAQVRKAEFQNGFLDDEHVLMTSKTHLNWLADWIQFRGDGTYSPGDLVLHVGEAGMEIMWPVWFTVALMSLYKKE